MVTAGSAGNQSKEGSTWLSGWLRRDVTLGVPSMRSSFIRSLFSCAAALAMAIGTAAQAQDACAVDLDDDGVVNAADIAILLGEWGPCTDCIADVDDSGTVEAADLAIILGFWGGTCVTLEWATIVEFAPDPTVVSDESLRNAIAATGLPWRVIDNDTSIELLLVPPGTFNMGCSASNQYGCSSDENPVHAVTLTSAFYLGRYEVTQAQWTATMGVNPSYHVASNGYPGSIDRPVEDVSWNEVQGFLSATALRLPSEAEWEYACRAGTATAFHSGPGFPSGTNVDGLAGVIAWWGAVAGGQTHPVGVKAANALGFHDMAGNVWEWVSDWYSSTYYSSSPPVNPAGPANGSFRAKRGGSFEGESLFVRSSMRGSRAPGFGDVAVGFRVARQP
jgi:formylglycine-generating enzyme required for sulfatase activity